ncbi:MAG: hypothetical protein KDJ90_00310 [Nitratireductor sp.]|nr:hypothetical protein [Nitratireductor sp.]
MALAIAELVLILLRKAERDKALDEGERRGLEAMRNDLEKALDRVNTARGASAGGVQDDKYRRD